MRGDRPARAAATTLRRGPSWLVTVAIAATALTAIVEWRLLAATGLVRSFYTDESANQPASSARTRNIDLAFLEPGEVRAGSSFRVWWGGFWYAPSDRTFDLTVHTSGRVEVVVDGRTVISHEATDAASVVGQTVSLSKGAHALIVQYWHDGGPIDFVVRAGPRGSIPRPLPSGELFGTQRDIERYRVLVGLWWLKCALTTLCVLAAALRTRGYFRTRLAAIGRALGPRRVLSAFTARGRWKSVRASWAGRPTVPQALLASAMIGLRLAALSALVIAQPLLDAVSRSPEFLIAHEASRTDIVLMVVGVMLLIPAVLTIPVFVAGLVGRSPQALAESTFVGTMATLFVMQIAKHAGAGSATVAIPLAAVLGVTAAVAYHRTPLLHSIATAASFTILVVPVLFLTTPAIRRLLAPAEGSAAARPRYAEAAVRNDTAAPIVLLIFDETPLVSLLDAEAKIDPRLYPAFAGLAKDGVLFRNATAVGDFTQWAAPAILSGQYPRPGATPTSADHPESIFALLAGAYTFEVVETATDVCPHDLCPPAGLALSERLELLASDLRYVYLHAISTADLAARLPSLTDNWRNFGELGQRRIEGQEEQARRRPGAMNRLVAEAFLERIRRHDEPVFFALHTLLQHFPHLQLPTGQFNGTQADVPAFTTTEAWNDDEWAVAQLHQRHLLELQLVDTYLNRLLNRLRLAGLYDRALIIVTADHGISFKPGTSRRAYSDAAAAEIVRVPLIIKLPDGAPQRVEWTDIGGQHISDRNAQTIDIVPTIAHVIGITVPWKVDGQSLFDMSRPEPEAKLFFLDFASQVRRFGREGPDVSAALQRKLDWFGAAADDLAPKPDRFAELVGRPLSELHTTAGAVIVEIDYLSQFLHRDRDAEDLAFDLAGRFDPDTHEANHPIDVAVAVNGVVESVTRTWRQEPLRWQATPPQSAWRAEPNDLQVFIIDDVQGAPLLRRCVVRPGLR